MKKLKKILYVSLALALLLVTFAGCGQSSVTPSPTESAASDKPYAGKTINILMEDVSDCDYIRSLLDQFEESTGITVNIEAISYSSMHEKLASQMISSTNSYDVIIVDCYWTGEFVDAGWLLPLDDYVKADNVDTSVYLPSDMKMNGSVDGVTYQLPFYDYCMCLLYRTDIWNDADLKAAYAEAYNGAELTVEDISVKDFIQETTFISDYYGKDTLAGMVQQAGRGDPIVMEWLNYLFGCGGDIYDENGNVVINSPEAVEAINLYKEGVEKASPTGSASFNFDDAYNVFSQGKAASMITYTWMLATLNNSEDSTVAGHVGIADTPGGTAFDGSWGWAIPHNAADPDLSWQFIKWVESPEIAKARALQGGAPDRTDVFSDPEVLAAYPYLSDVEAIISDSKTLPVVKDSNSLVESLTTGLSEIVAGEKEPQTALDEVAAFLETLK